MFIDGLAVVVVRPNALAVNGGEVSIGGKHISLLSVVPDGAKVTN
jgi:hypothetical protein